MTTAHSKLGYQLHVQKSRGPVLTFNGKSFTDRPENKPKMFSRADTAQDEAKRLLARFPILREYKVWVAAKFHTPVALNQKQRAMRGGSKAKQTTAEFLKDLDAKTSQMAFFKRQANPPAKGKRRKNPSASVNAELDAAAKKLEDFSGHPVQHLESAYSRSPQKTGLIVGELDLIGYRAKRDGKTERYGHHFKKNSRPLLAVTSDGKQLHVVGGQYEFTEAGIEDR
ncbi:MAG: hypothetical protein ACRETL_06980 [Gammaproteobacteria bacterium]